MGCTIWYHLYNLKYVKNTHGGVLILVKLQAEVCNFTKINTPLWVFFTFLKLCKWYQIAQRITYLKFKILLKVKYYCIAYGINYETTYQIGAKLKNVAEKNTSLKIIKCFRYIPMIDLFDKALQFRRLSF